MAFEEQAMGMRPKVGDTSVTLPVTFDYRGGRSTGDRFRKMVAVITLLITAVLVILALVSEGTEWYIRLIWATVFLVVGSLIARFPVMQEHNYRKTFKIISKNDFEMDPSTFWGIYDISEEYPYIVSYRNGRQGVFVRLNRDAVVGKFEKEEYEHYEAISQALRILEGTGINIAIVDTVESVGNDPRIADALGRSSVVKNPDMRNILVDVFQNLQNQMKNVYTTQEVYVFTYKGKEESFMNYVGYFLQEIMAGNYKGYEFLDKDGIRNLVSNIYNLHDFSVNVATTDVFSQGVGDDERAVIPLELVSGGVITKLNKSTEEKKLEAERDRKIKEFQEKARHQQKARRASSNVEEEDLDIF